MDWIACSDRLPELTHVGRWGEMTSDAVLVYRDTGIMEVLTFEHAGWSYNDGALIVDRRHVTHWMPLTSPPVSQAAHEAFEAAGRALR